LKEWPLFHLNREPELWARFIGRHDWALLLNHNIGNIHRYSRACREGRDPLTGDEDAGGLPFNIALLRSIPQFLLSQWELNLNGWFRPAAGDILSRILYELRRQSVGHYRCAIDAVFTEAGNLAGVLERSFGLAGGLRSLRERHLARSAIDPWAWLRYLTSASSFWDIVHLLDNELGRCNHHRIITPERLRLENWRLAAHAHLERITQTGPGFDWAVTHDSVEVGSLANQIVQLLGAYDEAHIAEELANEVHLVGSAVSEWGRQAEEESVVSRLAGEGSATGDPPPVQSLEADSPSPPGAPSVVPVGRQTNTEEDGPRSGAIVQPSGDCGEEVNAGPFSSLREYARRELKGKERAVIESLCERGGELRLPDLAVVAGVDWSNPTEGFKDTARRLKPKLKRIGWLLFRQDGAARLVRSGSEGGERGAN
jgi:hypothetical protein